MVWFTSKENGNVFEVHDAGHADQLKSAGHKQHDSDPRVKAVKPKSSAE